MDWIPKLMERHSCLLWNLILLYVVLLLLNDILSLLNMVLTLRNNVLI